MKTFAKLFGSVVVLASIMGFATQEQDIDVTQMIEAERELARDQQSNEIKIYPINKDATNYSESVNRLKNQLSVLKEQQQMAKDLLCQVGTKCNDLYPQAPVLCDAQSDEEVCNREGRWLLTE